jgi:hypothetical protein
MKMKGEAEVIQPQSQRSLGMHGVIINWKKQGRTPELVQPH